MSENFFIEGRTPIGLGVYFTADWYADILPPTGITILKINGLIFIGICILHLAIRSFIPYFVCMAGIPIILLISQTFYMYALALLIIALISAAVHIFSGEMGRRLW